MNLVVMISGGGTTLQNLLDRTADGRLDARIAGVVASRPDAFGLVRAAAAGVPAVVAGRGPGQSDRAFDAARRFAPDLVVLAGWLTRLAIPPDFRLKVVNVHPSLLPAFGGQGMYGRRVHRAVLDYGAKVTGCTVHFADDEYDAGPVVAQAAVPVLDDDTPEALAGRVFAAECELYPEVIRWLAENRVEVVGRRVRVRPPAV